MKNRKRTSPLHHIWAGAVVVALILVIVTLAFVALHGNSGKKTPETPVASVTPSPSQTPSVTTPATGAPTTAQPSQTPATTITADNVELQETEDYGQEYLDKFVFLGDSTTHGLSFYGVVNANQVWCPSNGTFSLFNQSIIRILYPETNEELTISEALGRKQPEYMLITLGINGISSMDEDYFKSEYGALVDTIHSVSPDTKIIINSIYPICASYDTSSGINMDKIRAANQWLRDLAVEKGVHFLNSNSALVDDTGFMPQAYTNGDGLHMNPDGLNIILQYIRTHGYPENE